MSFLTPLFLLGGLAVAAPIVYHLIRHITRQKVQFSSLLFLEPSPPQITRRSRLQDILLLILRCLVIAALALAFARPYMQKAIALPNAKGVSKRIIAMVDTSASMRRGDLWAQAMKELDKVVSSAGPGDEIAILTFDRGTTTHLRLEDSRALTPADRKARVQQVAAAAKPTWNNTHYGTALATALEMLHEAAMSEAESEQIVHLITDLQEGARMDGLQGLEWPKNTRVVLESLETAPSNASLSAIAQGGGAADSLRVRVSNSADSKKEQFKVGWVVPGTINFVGPSLDVYVPPGKTQTAAAPDRPKTPGALALMLTGDDHIFDNQLFVAASGQQNVSVLYFGPDEPADTAQPLYYLQRALEMDARQKIQVTRITATATPQQVQEAGLLVVASPLSIESANAVRAGLNNGKTALVALRSAEMGQTLTLLMPDNRLEVRESASRDALLGAINFEHPLFAPFADPRFSDFTKIRFWKRRAIELGEESPLRVIARFEDNLPALLQASSGSGSLFVLASGWQPAESQLALSSKFVPLLFGMLDYAGAIRTGAADARVGEPLALPKGRGELTLRPPAGESVVIGEDGVWSGTTQPGIYVLETSPPQEFAVNLDAAESRTKPRPIEEFEQSGVPLQEAALPKPALSPKSEKNLLAAELENRQKLWRWFLVAAVAALLFESALAAWKTARRTQAAEAAA